jgi:hypothetical protein
METLVGGAYAGCPYTQLPTGYMVWAVENNYFKNQWLAFYKELQSRWDFYEMDLNPEPKWNNDKKLSDWYQSWDDVVQKRYKSMITHGAWHWNSDKPKHQDAMTRLEACLVKLTVIYHDNKPKTTFDDFFANDDELGPGETEDDITMEEAQDIINNNPSEMLHAKLVAERSKPNATVDDILNRIRTRNQTDPREIAYQNILNQLENVTTMVSEQQLNFNLWEMRDIEWHLDTVKNRLYWLLRQREDE